MFAVAFVGTDTAIVWKPLIGFKIRFNAYKVTMTQLDESSSNCGSHLEMNLGRSMAASNSINVAAFSSIPEKVVVINFGKIELTNSLEYGDQFNGTLSLGLKYEIR